MIFMTTYLNENYFLSKKVIVLIRLKKCETYFLEIHSVKGWKLNPCIFSLISFLFDKMIQIAYQTAEPFWFLTLSVLQF